MQYQTDTLYHVFNRGNNREQLFFQPSHYLYFLAKLRQHVRPICPLIGYCLMPNHFHLLLYPGALAVAPLPLAAGVPRGYLSGALATLLSSFSQGLNQQQRRTGLRFEGRTQARPLTSDRYAAHCLHYVHQNPVRAGLSADLAGWPYSSYRDYAGLRLGTLCDLALGRELLELPPPTVFAHESARALDPDLVRTRLYGAR